MERQLSSLPSGIRKGRTGIGYTARYGGKHLGTFETVREAVEARESCMSKIRKERGGVPGGVLVDDSVVESVSQFRWTFSTAGYCRASINGKDVYLHRYVMGLFGIEIPKGKVVDHINENKKDNRISNLRVVSHASNIRNQKNRVSVRRNKNKWIGSVKNQFRSKSRSFSSKECARSWVLIQREIILRGEGYANKQSG